MCLAAGAVKDSIVGEERLVRHLLLELAHQPHFTGASNSILFAYTCLYAPAALLRIPYSHLSLLRCNMTQ